MRRAPASPPPGPRPAAAVVFDPVRGPGCPPPGSRAAGCPPSAAAAVMCRVELRAPAAARRLADGFARLAIEVEVVCAREDCGPGCPVAVAVRRVAVSSSQLAQEWRAGERRR